MVLAVNARHVRRDLCANTNSVADLDVLDLVANLDGASDNLMSYIQSEWIRVSGGGRILTNAEWHWRLAPASSDRVNVRSANTARINGDIDIILLERLQVVLGLLERRPVLKALGLEAHGSLWVRHRV